MVHTNMKMFAIKAIINAGGKKLLDILLLGQTKKRKAKSAAIPKMHKQKI